MGRGRLRSGESAAARAREPVRAGHGVPLVPSGERGKPGKPDEAGEAGGDVGVPEGGKTHWPILAFHVALTNPPCLRGLQPPPIRACYGPHRET